MTIKQPDGTSLKSQHKSELEILPLLPQKARESYAFKNIKFPLLSVAKLCDSNYTVVFVKTKAYIIYKGKIIGEAPRDTVSKLWTMKLQNLNDCTNKHEQEVAMNVTVPEETENNIERLILFLHEALGHPNKYTLIKAVKKGHLATWPGLTVKRIQKYIMGDIINAKGHMHMKRQVKRKGKNNEPLIN